jgi:alpha-tubulin suppressor-like RCC1 family protein
MARPRSAAACAIVIAGCFSPRLPEGLPCTASNECPGALRCDPVTRTCVGELVDGPVVPCNFRGVAAGRKHTCAIDGDGGAWCWGLNDQGQVAPGSSARSALAPAQIDLPAPAVQIAAGRDFSCARLEDGAVWCWGSNVDGELGDGTLAFRDRPVAVVLGAERAIDLGTGSHHACIRRERDLGVSCWGNNDKLVLGVTGISESPLPLEIPNTAGSRQLAVGHRQSCAIDVDGVPVCWGHNANGQLGDGMYADRALPAPVAGLAMTTRITSGGRFGCAIDAAGDTRCWGHGSRGQLGRGNFGSDALPSEISIGGAVDVQAGAAGACVVTSAGTVSCWGELDSGSGVIELANTPRQAMLTGATSLVVGYYHTCAVADARLVCWGSNEEGELGRGTRALSASPVAVPLDDASDISTGRYHACARRGGALSCWGRNNDGQIGDGTTVAALAPALVSTGLATVEGVAAGSWHTCAWGGGAARCWGENYNGECGNGVTSARVLSPVPVAGVTGITEIGTGWDHTCARTTAGEVLCWGANYHGQLGNGTMTASLAPVTVGLGTATELAIGRGFGCAVVSGAVLCWGANFDGQLGDGTTTTRAAPVAVTLPGPVIDAAAGATHTCAIVQGGDLFCWGRNAEGELGLGDTTYRPSPVQVPLPGPALAVTAAEAGTCARLAAATYCWGRGAGGELGTGATDGSTIPLLVSGLGGVDQVARGDRGGCARAGGSVSCWGEWRLLANGDTSHVTPAPPLFSCR